jgi:cellobiose phosphorylase
VYIYDCDTGRYWCTTYAPIREPSEYFECRHGLGWTTFIIEKYGIRTEQTVFVPVDGPVELWTIKITNLSKRTRRLTVFPFVEWTLDEGVQGIDDLTYAACTDAWFEPETQCAVVSRRFPYRFAYVRAFMTMDIKPDGYDLNRAGFIGAGRTLRNPVCVEHGRTGQSTSYAEISVGVLSKRITLKPNSSTTFNVMIGMAQTRNEREKLREKWLLDGKPEKELQRVKDFWEKMGDVVCIKTPDRALDRYVNRWLVKHVYTLGGTMCIRGAGTGYRNYVQDGLGMLYINPAIARQILLDALSYQLETGECFLWIYFDGREPRGPSHVDTKVWVVYLICGYVRETGDTSILREKVNFWKSSRKSSVIERLYLILDKCWQDRGKHGLSLVGGGDWNDNLSGMGQKGRGESTWMSFAVLWAMRQAVELLSYTGEKSKVRELTKRIEILQKALHKYAWDKDRYIMGYTDDYEKVGARNSPQVKLFLLPQVWAVLSGASTEDQNKKMWRLINKYLESDYGPLLMERPYTKVDRSIGRITFLAQGMNENGPAYSHATAFKLLADSMCGYGDILYADLLKLLPYTHDSRITLAEPYVLSNFYRPPAVPRKYGATHRSWTTSTPNWLIRVILEGMMGVKAGYDGIRVDPVLPRRWGECWIRRCIRGTIYEFTIKNPHHVERGVAEIYVDGEKSSSNIIPYMKDGKKHQVIVIMG